MTDRDIVERLREQADGYAEAASAEGAQWGEGTEDQVGLEQHSALLFDAAAEIECLREAIVNQAKEWQARAEKAEAALKEATGEKAHMEKQFALCEPLFKALFEQALGPLPPEAGQ